MDGEYILLNFIVLAFLCQKLSYLVEV